MKAVKLSDIASLTVGFVGTMAEHYSETGITFLRSLNIKPYRIDSSDMKYITAEFARTISKSELHANDVVIVRTGIPGTCCVVPNEYDGSNCSDVVIAHPDLDKVNPHYLAAYINEWGQRQVSNNKVGAIQKHFNVHTAENMVVFLPDKKTQTIVAAILCNLNDKIAKNEAICAELESMAKSLYDYWFVQFDFPDENGKPYRTSGGKMIGNDRIKREIPNGWKDGNLYEIADYVNGLACQKYRPDIGEEGLPVIKIKEMHDGISEDTEFVSMNIPRKYVVEDGDLLFSWSATLETMFWYGGKGGLNQHIFKVVPKAPYPIEFVYEQLSAYIINFVKMAEARKTTMGHITTDHLNQSRIVLPPHDVLEKYSEKVKPIYQKVGQLKKENKVLSQLRDWLLPMLMNGQAKVVDAKKEETPIAEETATSIDDPRFVNWLNTMGLAARGTVDRQTLHDIFDAMDEDDKQ